MLFIFDLETTGLPPRNVKPTRENIHLWDSCRIVEIAWEAYDTTNTNASANTTRKCVSQESHLIIPDGFTIPEGAIKIHGITNEMARNEGIAISDAIAKLATILPHVQCMVAHNISFDINVLTAELVRYGRADLAAIMNAANHVCTMKRGTEPQKKWPKLAELYQRYFNITPDQKYGALHRAQVDVRCCADIYFHQEENQHK